MDAANDLIERLERETGSRVDDPNSAAFAGLFGAIARLMGKSPGSYRQCDDVAAGTVILHQMSPRGEAERAARETMADMIAAGFSPEDAASLLR